MLVKKHRFFLLFVYLMLSLILFPYMKEGTTGYRLFRMLNGGGILLTVYAIGLRRSLLVIALLLAIPAVVQRLLPLQPNIGSLAILNILLSFVFDIFVVVVIFRRVFTNEQPNSETIFGALCIYLLVGFSFASVYGLTASLEPSAFYLDPLTNTHLSPDRFDFIYYSFATMTSVGAAGIVAVSDQARSFSIIEALLGVLYLAVLIARLVGAYRHPSTFDHE